MTRILIVDDSLVERVLVEGLLVRNPNYQIDLAENGYEAMEKIAAHPPHLIITDLLMPEMDGLELLREVRQRQPDIPVVLMTAYGDESTAAEALEAGAASYVPKARQAECLVATVERVLEHAAVDGRRRRLSRSVMEFHCRWALENDPRLIRGLVDELQEIMAGMDFAERMDRIRMGEAIEEALLNAMYHGNLEISEEELIKTRAQLDERLLHRLIEERCRDERIAERTILVVAHLQPDEARFVIRDQGRGFNVRYADVGRGSDHFEGGNHRGLTLIRSLMDEVTFNESGNELTLRKYTSRAAAPSKAR